MTTLRGAADIEHVVYINLARRPDRRREVEAELARIGWAGRAERFDAVNIPNNGALGCSMSHLAVLRMALARGWNHVVVLEDDVEFTEPARVVPQLDACLRLRAAGVAAGREAPWQVLLLAGNNVRPVEHVDHTCCRTTRCHTTTAYLVAGAAFMRVLAQNIAEGATLLARNPARKAQFAVDVHWFSLQREFRWLLLLPLSVTQRAGHSDIEGRTLDYRRFMLTLDKSDPACREWGAWWHA
jgi:glycosyl transferase family 25